MNHLRLIVFVLCLLTPSGLALASQPVESCHQQGFVVIKISVDCPDLNTISLRYNPQLAPLAAALSSINYLYVERTFPYCQPPCPGGADLTRIYNVRFPESQSVAEACSLLQQTGLLEYAEPRPLYHTVMDYNDPWAEDHGQYGLGLIDASEAHDICIGDTLCFIGIVDTGFDMVHEDLAPNIWVNPGEDLNSDGQITEQDINDRDDDGNGFIDDFQGWDFIDRDNTPEDTHRDAGHGTHCGGVASAATNNRLGVASIGYNCRLLPVRVGAGREITFGLEGIVYAVELGCRVISCSWGGDEAYQEALDVMRYARDHGALVIAAAGNDNHANPLYPAAYDEVMAVSATDERDRRANFSNYGNWITLSAPGVDILSAYSQNRYAYMSGTSMSAPLVAGLAGLMLAYNPDLTDQEVWEILVATADNIDNENPAYRGRLGAGRINARAALEAAAPPPHIAFAPEAFDLEMHQDIFREFILTISNQGRGNLLFSLARSPADAFWLEREPMDIQLAAGQSEELPFTVTTFELLPGEYEAELLVMSNDRDHPQQSIPVVLTVLERQDPHFPDPPPSDYRHNLLINSLTCDGEPVPSGWEVGVFTTDDMLAGGGVWSAEDRLGIAAYGDDPQTQAIEGFMDGEEFNFKVWDNRNNVLYKASADYFWGPDRWHNDGFSIVNLSAFNNREIFLPLRLGWNMISINVSPGEEFYVENEARGPDIRLMLEQFRTAGGSHISLFKNGEGQFYSPAFDFCNILYWDLSQGYQICLFEDFEASWAGAAIPADQEIRLTNGWNLIAYYPTYELDASAPDFYVLSSIIDFVQIAKDGVGRFLWPEWDFSNMLPWQEGQGYQVRIAADAPVVFHYPQEGRHRAGVETSPRETTGARSSDNMSVLVLLTEADQSQLSSIIAVDADNRPCGQGKVDVAGRCGLAVWGDEPASTVREGLTAGEAFDVVGVGLNGDIFPLRIGSFRTEGGLEYSANGFCVVEATLGISLPSTMSLSKIHPNPFNASAVVTFELLVEADILLEAIDCQGRVAANLAQGRYSEGVHQVRWNGENLPTGLYILRLKAGGPSISRKAVIVR